MIKTQHQNSKTHPLDESFGEFASHPHESDATSGIKTETELKSKAMYVGDILKIAELSRKYGPLFYQDPLIMRSLGLLGENFIASSQSSVSDNLE